MLLEIYPPDLLALCKMMNALELRDGKDQNHLCAEKYGLRILHNVYSYRCLIL